MVVVVVVVVPLASSRRLVVESSAVPAKDSQAKFVGGDLAMSASCDIFTSVICDPG